MLERSGYPASPSVSGFLPCGDPGGRPCHMRPPQSEHSPVSRTETDTSAVHTSLTLCYSVVVSEAVKDSIARWVFFSHWSFHNCLSWKKKKKSEKQILSYNHRRPEGDGVSISHPFISSSSFLFNYPGTCILIGSKTQQITGNASHPPTPSTSAQVSRFK